MCTSGELNFRTEPFAEETEITGHPLAHLAVSTEEKDGLIPSDMDIFVTIRHYDAEGKESKCLFSPDVELSACHHSS